MMVLCTVLAAGVIGGNIAFQANRDSLRNAVFNRLTELRESQTGRWAVRSSDLKNSIIIYTHGAVTRDALEAFSAGFNELSNAPINPAQWQNIVDYCNNTFIKETERYSGTTLDAAALLPRSNAERYLQANYTALRKNDDNAITMTDARDGSKWSTANAKYQDFFRQIVTRFEFQDALLIDGAGNVVFNAYKGVDLGTNIVTGPYRDPNSRRPSPRRCRRTRSIMWASPTSSSTSLPRTPDRVDGGPLRRDGRPEGVLALQFPITKINRLMTFDKQWKEAGLGETGETILGGPDELMRSDSRLFLEDPQRYKQAVVAAAPHRTSPTWPSGRVERR